MTVKELSCDKEAVIEIGVGSQYIGEVYRGSFDAIPAKLQDKEVLHHHETEQQVKMTVKGMDRRFKHEL